MKEEYLITVFDELAIAYDNTIDWTSRLEREIPFILAKPFSEDKKLVLDIACGSGRHAVELAKRGLTVSAFDSSQSMIDVAFKLAENEGVDVAFRVLNMLDMSTVYSNRFDLVLCLGNSLALLPSMTVFEKTLGSIYDLMETKGIFIFQTLNFEAVEEQGIRFMPTKTGRLDSGEEVTFSRFLDYTQGDVEKAILVLSALLESSDSKPVVESQEVLRITGPIIEKALSNAGFCSYEIYSDYASTPFQREFDRTIVVRAIK